MKSFAKTVFLILFPFSSHAQDGFPEKCEIRPYMNLRCCIFPPFFNKMVAKECGARFAAKFTHAGQNVTVLVRDTGLGDRCTYWRCVLKKYDLLLEEDQTKVDLAKYYAHLTSWVELNPEFNDVMVRAKIECKQFNIAPLPLRICEFYTFQSCIRGYIEVYCPKRIESPDCHRLKKFYDECGQYYL